MTTKAVCEGIAAIFALVAEAAWFIAASHPVAPSFISPERGLKTLPQPG